MRRSLAFLVLAIGIFSANAQAPIKLLYLTSEDPIASGDTLMPGYLAGLGFDVTLEVLSETSPVAGYDVVFCGVLSSGNVNWTRYKTAPIPLVTTNINALKATALNWVGPGATQNYDSSSDTLIKVVAQTHPIVSEFTESEIKVVDDTEAGANVMWFYMGAVPNMTIVALAGTEIDDTLHSIVTMDAGTAINADVTLENRAVVIGFMPACWQFLNEEGKTIIKNACEWAAEPCLGVLDNKKVKTYLYPNPSTGIIKLNIDERITEISVIIVSIDGRIVFKKERFSPQLEELDLSVLNSGVYFIHTEGSMRSYTEKLILSK